MPDKINVASLPSLESQDFSKFAYSYRKVDLLKSLGQSSFQDYLENKYQTPEDATHNVSSIKGQYLSIYALAGAFLVGAAAFWLAFFIFKKIMDWYRPEHTESNLRIWSYFISGVHAVLGIFGFIHLMFFSCSKPGHNFVTSDSCFDQTSAGLQIYFIFSMAYFVCDLITLVPIFGNESKMVRETQFHHGISIAALCGGILVGRWIGIIVANLMLTELSTIFLDVRSIMKELAVDEKYNKCFVVNGLLLLLSFFLTRVIFLTWFTVIEILPYLFRYNWNELYEDYGLALYLFCFVLMVLYFTLYFMNQVWFYKMQRGARKYLNGRKDSAQNEGENADDFQRKVDAEEQG